MSPADLLGFLPKPVAIALAGMVLGGVAFAGADFRYVKASDFAKSYVLQLKREIRDLRKDIREETDDRMRDQLRDDLEELIDELCYEAPNDRECQG